ncbi:dimethylhistidine N-methyltransferase [Methylobacterium sp. PvP062]|jgi:dimethylhistidine N-methyltransferase|uniref:Dimethylhistidine N-methyltransferase n=1 Tax=Methylobacterium radiotolerans TaxID=31998 RepID=A0ABV2NFQ1_9HYPH|nr:MULTISPECIES: L-histidine N(alpha)-methyltransferase [unclassified Methylobacterium]MBP2497938.1 dimethylhistidine N-methyltransferase [Methylobacterium sp. PvP105]MBP2502191.1 dimethylhistidine N-methyltransferase [Methylobacterium sp. PvP109]MCX7334953.1 L-histidine N(alpha)-methyltransferase [Hyphomicrobiales bacterium]RUP21674.1 MAG: L-histidine N(alpha)-methyltransferase [Methylobacterium sp.]
MTDSSTDSSTDASTDAFLQDALAGLTAEPKTLPGKYLWDETGSDLFDRICHSADYYPTAQEMTVLPQAAADVARRVPPGVTVVEFGSGASRKIRTLLDALPDPAAYVAIDISGAYLEAAIRRLAADYPGIPMIPVCADYSQPVRLPRAAGPGGILGFYPGTSIGNFDPREARLFLERARATLGPSLFLVGADGTADPDRLQRAYGRADGLMAAFHRNILTRLNRELGADFDRDNFRHAVRICPDPLRVEAHLVATRPATYRLGDRTIAFAAAESIRTDISHKYPADAFRALAVESGWQPRALWKGEGGDFNLHLLQAEP